MAEDYIQHLTFNLAGEVFAVNIETVREVLELTLITKMPRMPSYMRGVINLRGHAVPVIDLRLKFGMAATEDTVNTCIIITEVTGESGELVIGMLVDSVREVLDLERSDIEPPPSMGASIRTDFVKGIGRQENSFIIILDVDRVFNVHELDQITETALSTPMNAELTESAAIAL